MCFTATRSDFVLAMDDLEEALPGYRFGCEERSEGGLRILHYPGYRPGRRDVTWLLCVLRRWMGGFSSPTLMKIMFQYVGPLTSSHGAFGRDSPYKSIRMFGLAWPGVSGGCERERTLWRHDQTEIFRTCIVDFRLQAHWGAPKWSDKELSTVCDVFHRRLGLRNGLWGKKKVTKAKRARGY